MSHLAVSLCVPTELVGFGALIDHAHLRIITASGTAQALLSERGLYAFSKACRQVIAARPLGPLSITLECSRNLHCEENSVPLSDLAIPEDVFKASGIRLALTADHKLCIELVDDAGDTRAVAVLGDVEFEQLMANGEDMLELLNAGGFSMIACEGRA